MFFNFWLIFRNAPGNSRKLKNCLKFQQKTKKVQIKITIFTLMFYSIKVEETLKYEEINFSNSHLCLFGQQFCAGRKLLL